RRLAQAVVPARWPGGRALRVRTYLVHEDRESEQAGSRAHHEPVLARGARIRQLQVPAAAEPAAALRIDRASRGGEHPCTSDSWGSAGWATTCAPGCAPPASRSPDTTRTPRSRTSLISRPSPPRFPPRASSG